MTAHTQSLSTLSEVLGHPIFSLSTEWFAHHRSFVRQEWDPYLSKHGYQLSYVTDEARKPGKIYILSKNKNGDYNGVWVDPSSPYDLAILNEDYVRALGLAEQRVQASPKDASALFDKASALNFLSRYEDCIDYYNQVLALEPTNAAAFTNKANALSSLHRNGEAIVYYKKALAMEPDCLISKSNLAGSYLEMGFYTEYLRLKEEIFCSRPFEVEDRLLQHNLKQDMGWHSRADFELSKEDFLRGGKFLRPAHVIRAAANDDTCDPPPV